MIKGGVGKVKRLDMGKAKEILRLREMGLSVRDIAASVRCGKSSVAETIKRADAAGVRCAGGYTETALEGKLFPEKTETGASQDEPDVSYLLVELGKKHVTRQLLWEEYKTDHPNGVMYTQFCERIRCALKADEIDYHKPHKAGEECEVDWAGTKIPYYDEASRSFKDASIFVAVLPASNYPFAYAYPDEKADSWIDAHVRTFQFMGGTPRILIPDCTKAAVTTTDLFDPVLSKTYYEMASHYDITIVPARPYHPKDKNLAENGVQNVSRRIIAALRNENFTSMEQVNKAVREKLMALIDRKSVV
jgi:transposase